MIKAVLFNDLKINHIADRIIIIFTQNKLHLLKLIKPNVDAFLSNIQLWSKFAKLKSYYKIYEILELKFFLTEKQLLKNIWELTQ